VTARLGRADILLAVDDQLIVREAQAVRRDEGRSVARDFQRVGIAGSPAAAPGDPLAASARPLPPDAWRGNHLFVLSRRSH
jgi:hypothetical protein